MSKISFKINRLYCLAFINFIVLLYIVIMYNKISHRSRSASSLTLFDAYQDSKLMKSSANGCKWKFHHYSPSPWEMYWYNNITTLQKNVCSTLMQADQMKKSTAALEYMVGLQKKVFRQSFTSNEYDELLSKMYYQYECAKSSQSTILVSQYIEPLIGLLRDPLTICPYNNGTSTRILDKERVLQSKRFLLVGPSAPYHNFRTSVVSIAPWLHRPGSQTILFDIGSSYFNCVENGTSHSTCGMRWFYEYFRSNLLQIDRIIAFEIIPYFPRTYWDQIPDDIIGKLTFINVGADRIGKYNPWNILKSIAKPTDYVIIKFDIDRKLLESSLINQVLNDKSISSLIDEMFFEIHVTVNDMLPYWTFQPGELKDNYILFRKLRKLGIRMHSWP